MTCKECFHWKACKSMLEEQGYSVGEDFAGDASRCDTFVNAADVVAVVRCKDCKLRDTEGCPFMYWYCGILLGCTSDNNYCNYGERRE